MKPILIVDYGLSAALPQPVPVATHPGRRGKPTADEASVR